MRWSIAAVARMSGATSRTLRHYDAIGLLAPAYVGTNGYRYYERAELLRLQRIRLLRELGLGLDVIGELLDDGRDPAEALRAHRRLLVKERDRLDRLVDTVDRTLADLEGGEDMQEHPEQWFTGFDAETQRAYEAEARQRWGDTVVEDSKARMAGCSRDDVTALEAEAEAVNRGLLAVYAAGLPAGDPRAMDAVDAHYRWVSRFWTPDREGYTGLGRMYAEDERFTAYYDRYATGLASYLRDAIAAYASARLV